MKTEGGTKSRRKGISDSEREGRALPRSKERLVGENEISRKNHASGRSLPAEYVEPLKRKN